MARSPSTPTPPDFRQHLEVETPEHVVLDYELAGIGSRALAAMLDMLALLGIVLALDLVMLFFGFSSLGRLFYVVAIFVLFWGYFTFFEAFRRGQTPGKRRAGIRVIRDTGHAITFGDAAARNLLRIADALPPPYLIGILFVAIHPRAKRLGDLVAGTVVVRDHPVEIPTPAAPTAPATKGRAAGPPIEVLSTPLLSEEEYSFLDRVLVRLPDLGSEVRTRLIDQLAARFADRLPEAPTALAGLQRLQAEEAARRQGPHAAHGRGGDASRGAVVAHLVARQSDRWQAFQGLAERASRLGLNSFAAEELPEFAARYREVAADLARARTYGADQGVLLRLERLVAAGHNALYRSERHTWRGIFQFLARECPRAVVAGRRYVLVACLAFTVPALGGYAVLRDRPHLAGDLLSDVVLERAHAGHARIQEGKGYFETGGENRPLVATLIITNNVNVAFNAFAMGIFLGVGSLVALAYNGLMIGAIAGHFANEGLAGYLWTFVIGHGVLELFAIWVAGGAGLLLGRAIIAPGDLTRRDALVVHGRLAIRMVGAAAILLLVAGLIEGFISSSTLPVPVRLAASGLSTVVLIGGWILGNRKAEDAHPRRPG